MRIGAFIDRCWRERSAARRSLRRCASASRPGRKGGIWRMLTEVMRHYRLARPPVDVGFFETEHHAQVARDMRAAIQAGRLIALTAVIGSGKTMLSRRLRDDLEREGRVIVSRVADGRKGEDHGAAALAALFYDSEPREDRFHLQPVGAARARPSGTVPEGQEAGSAVHR